MENSTSQTTLILENHTVDYSISSLLGLSTGVVITIFAITVIGLQLAKINLMSLFSGTFQMQGDPSLLYLGIFLICATILLVIQHHFQEDTENTEDLF